MAQSRLQPILRGFEPVGSTRYVDFDTTKPVYETDPDKCHVNLVAGDSNWEHRMAQALEEIDEVKSYVKNQGLGFTVPYTFEGRSRTYVPDFIARADDGHGDDLLNLVIEVTGERRKEKVEKVATMRDLWVPAVNAHGGFGRWAVVEVTDPWDAHATDPQRPRRSARLMPPAKKTTKKKAAAPTPVEATTHADTRVNIPTDAQRDFVADDERAPLPVSIPRYAEDRDPSLDPQLIWNGKIAQDADGLDVPAVPIYIQEKIDPRAIIENLRDTAAPGEDEPELSLFDDFDGLGGYDLVEFYEHDANWANRLVLGDSLLVMTSLAEKERMRGKVQMIYVDPPYGIKFGSNWQVSTRKRDVKDGKAEDVTRQPEQIKAFRDTWELGIHSYLSYLRDRFTVARELLTETGSIFVQIGDENVHLVRSVMDEVFGSENFVSLITFRRRRAQTGSTGRCLGGDGRLHRSGTRSDTEHVKYRQLFRDEGVERSRRRAVHDGSRQPDGDSASTRAMTPNSTRRYLRDRICEPEPTDVADDGREHRVCSQSSSMEGRSRPRARSMEDQRERAWSGSGCRPADRSRATRFVRPVPR